MNLAALQARFLGAPESLLAHLRTLLDTSELVADRRDLNRAIEQLAPRCTSHAGRVAFPVASGDDGLLLHAIATFGVAGHSLAPAAEEHTARAWLAATLPGVDLSTLTLGVSRADGWTGSSCEAALVAAAISLLLDRPPKQRHALTGHCDGSAPALVPGKQRATREAWGAEGVLLCTSPHAPLTTCLDQLLGADWRGGVLALHAESPRLQLARAWGRHQKHAAESAQIAERLLAQDLPPALLGKALWMRGAQRLHLGEAVEGLGDLQQAFSLLPAMADDAEFELLTREELVSILQIALLDNGRVREASDLGHTTLEALAGVSERGARWRMACIQVAGSTARCLVPLGDLLGALRLVDTWSLGLAQLPDQHSRAHGDRAELLRRLARLPEARDALAEARRALLDTDIALRGPNQLFQTLFATRLDLAERAQVAVPMVEGIWPGLAFRCCAALLAPDVDAALLPLRPQASLPLAWLWTATVTEAMLRGEQVPKTWPAARDILDAMRFDDPALDTLRHALAATPHPDRTDLTEWARRCPY